MCVTREAVIAAIHTLFPPADFAAVLELLDLYGVESHERERERVQLAILTLSDGDENKLLYLIQAAKIDYRDVLAWEELGPLSEAEGRRATLAAMKLIETWGKKTPE